MSLVKQSIYLDLHHIMEEGKDEMLYKILHRLAPQYQPKCSLKSGRPLWSFHGDYCKLFLRIRAIIPYSTF